MQGARSNDVRMVVNITGHTSRSIDGRARGPRAPGGVLSCEPEVSSAGDPLLSPVRVSDGGMSHLKLGASAATACMRVQVQASHTHQNNEWRSSSPGSPWRDQSLSCGVAARSVRKARSRLLSRTAQIASWCWCLNVHAAMGSSHTASYSALKFLQRMATRSGVSRRAHSVGTLRPGQRLEPS